MKKTLIALAALAATASFAQSSVQIYGLADVGFQANDYKGNKVNGINGNGSTTSQLNIKVVEDLGGGLKANLFVENDWNLAQTQANTGYSASFATAKDGGAASWLNSEIKVGLSGGFGTVDGGVVNNQQLTAVVTAQPFGTAIGSGYGSVLKAAALTAANGSSVVRFDNSVRYVSPAFNGFSFGGYYAAKQTKAADTQVFSTTLGAYDRAGVQELSAMYNNGPINAIFSQQVVDYTGVATAGAYNWNGTLATTAPASGTAYSLTPTAGTAGTAKVTMNSLAANYTLGALTLGAITQTNKDNLATTGVNTEAYLLSAKYVMGANTFGATTGELKNKLASSGKKSKFWGIGYDYALSKNTSLYARYESLTDDAGTVAAVTGYTEVGTKRTRSALGVRIGF